MNRYPPGQTVRISLTALLKQNPSDPGALSDPANSVVTARLPGPSGTPEDGTSIVATPVRDSLGLWHADFTIPVPSPPGIGSYRWQSSGSTAQDALAQQFFRVVPLAF